MLCPVIIYSHRLTELLPAFPQTFPPASKLDPAVYGPPESAIREEDIAGHLDGMTVQQVLISDSPI